MAITGIGSHTVPSSVDANPTYNTLGKNDFLQLLIAQLQHQDPLKPMESTEFTTQLAQFSSLEQLYTVNDNLGLLANAQASANNAQAVSMIGKTVRALGDEFYLTQGSPVDLWFSLNGDTTETVVNIFDAQGGFVRSLSSGALTSGEQCVSWDGRNSQGNPVAGGYYRFEVIAGDYKGNLVEAKRFITGRVSSVSYIGGGAHLSVNGLPVPLSTVVSVAENEPDAGSNESIISWMNQPLEVKL